MNLVLDTLARFGLLGRDLDDRLLRAAAVVIFAWFGWDKAVGGFPSMSVTSAFLLKDLVLLAVSFYLPKQDASRLATAGTLR